MINLLPQDYRDSLRYARKNSVLRTWITNIMIGIAGIIVIVFSGIWFIDRSIQHQQKQVNIARNQLKSQKLEETQARVTSISDSVKLVADVLSRQILFSSLLEQIGSVMPEGSLLETLTINDVTGGLDLSARATNYQAATQVQLNLEDPAKKIFEKADIITISCLPEEDVDDRYPCSVSIRALFAKENSFQYSSKKVNPQWAVNESSTYYALC